MLAQTVGLLVARRALTHSPPSTRLSASWSKPGDLARGVIPEHQQVDAQVWAVPERVWQFVMDGELLVIAHKPYIVPVLALLVLFPFAAVLARRGPLDAPWAFLDPGGRLQTPPLALRPLLPLALGALAGLVFLVLAALIRLYMHYGVSAETRAMDATLLSFFVAMVCARDPRPARGGRSGGVARRSRRRAVSFVAGCFGWLGIIGGPAAGGGAMLLSLNPGPCAWTIDGTVSWHVFQQLILQGAIAALAGGLVVVGIHALLHRKRTEELHPAAAG